MIDEGEFFLWVKDGWMTVDGFLVVYGTEKLGDVVEGIDWSEVLGV